MVPGDVFCYLMVQLSFWVESSPKSKNLKSFPEPDGARTAPISVSIALRHASANAVKGALGG